MGALTEVQRGFLCCHSPHSSLLQPEFWRGGIQYVLDLRMKEAG